jgi:hypothetical protein
MLQIIHTPSQTVVSEHAYQSDAERALSVIETNPPSHEITGEPEVVEAVITDGVTGE